MHLLSFSSGGTTKLVTVTHPALTPARQAGTQFTYPGGMEGWVDLDDWLHAETVYPVIHPRTNPTEHGRE